MATFKTLNKVLTLSVSSVALAVGAGSASAQANQSSSAPSAAQGSDPASLGPGDIIVTARKVNETALEVPISITSLSGDQLTNNRVATLEDIVPRIPNFTFTRGATGSYRTMRGGGSTGSSFSFEQSTGLFVDNVSYGRNEQGRIPVFDVQSVDVLRGPQVITFGNSTTAGAIAITTKKPGDEFEGDLSTSYEFVNHETTVQGGISIPVTQKLSIRVAGYYDSLQKGWVENTYGGSRDYGPKNTDWAVRAIAVDHLTDDATLTLKYEHDDLSANGTNLVPTDNPLNNPLVPVVGFITVVNKGQPAPFNIPSDYLRMRQNTYFAQLDYDLGFGKLTSTTNYWTFQWAQGANAGQTAQAVSFYETLDHYREFSNETRIQGKITSRLDYLTGVYFVRGTQGAQTILSLNQAPLGVANPAPPFSRLTNLDMRTTTFSVFADAKWHFTDRLSIEPGVRYSRIWRDGDQSLVGADVVTGVPSPAYNVYVPTVAGGVVHDFQNLQAPESHLMPQVVVSYRADRDTNLFARFVKGAKSGGIDWTAAGSNPAQAVFRAEDATDFEAGIKTRLFRRRLDLDVTFFDTRYTNLQVSTLSLARFVVANAGSSISRGVEVAATAHPVRALTIGATVAYLDAHYTDFKNGTCTVQQSLTLPAPCTRDLTGERTPFASRWSAGGHIDYDYDAGSFTVRPSVDGSFRGPFNASPNVDPVGQRPALFLLDARLQFAPTGGRWNIAIYGKNLTNQIYSNFVSAGGATLVRGVTDSAIERPRQVGLQFNLKM